MVRAAGCLLHSQAVKIQEQVPLAPLTTLRVGGPARYFVKAASEADVREAEDFARSRDLLFFVLGGGSNLLVSDRGFSGLVLKVAISGIEETGQTNKAVFEAGAGVDWDEFVAVTVARNCAGLECLSGVPGTVGGTPVQNVGAYGQEVSETIVAVEAFDTRDGIVRRFTNLECGFSYRTSVFNTVERGRYIILRVSFELKRGGAPKLAYADLKRHFAAEDIEPSLAQVREAVLSIRKSKGMVMAKDDPDCRSAGSFFKNPILSDEQFRDLEQRASARGLRVPSYPALSSQHKVSAAWLVEQVGFRKGFALGPAGISSKHSLAIINRGGATAADIIALKTAVQRGVVEQFGIELKPEPVFLGFDDCCGGP